MKLAIIGAGGHAREVFMSFRNSKFSKEIQLDGFFIENPNKSETLFDFLVKDISLLDPSYHLIHIAVGDISFRKKYYEKLKKLNFTFLTIIDSTSNICKSVVIGEGSYISPSTTINVECKIGICTIINSGTIISHNGIIGDFCNLSPGVISCGQVMIGDNCYIGAGVILREKIIIGDLIFIGMGSIVTSNINIPGRYIIRGNLIKKLE